MRFTLNGRDVDVNAHPMARLLDVLREDLGLTGTKEGCGEGECGACTVLVEGAPVCACLVPLAQVEACDVTTIEALGDDHPVQHAFMDEVGAQCGICTPGMIVAALPLLDAHGEGAHLSLEKIKAQLAGNLCRCTGYEAIYRAILRAAVGEGEGGGGGGGGRGRELRATVPPPPPSPTPCRMRTAISTLELREPRSVADALKLLRDDGPLVPLAGATDLYVSLNFGTLPGTRFLDLWRLAPLRKIEKRDGVLCIGALATYTQIIKSRHARAQVPMLVEAARQIGGVQIQNRGTIGGNVANASPAGDALPVLAALDATVVLRSAAGERRVPFAAFYTGYRASVRRPDELIVALEIPAVEGPQWFRKVGTRAAQAISKVVMAAVRAETPRIAFGSVGPTVVRAPRTEAALAAGAPIEAAVRVLAEEITPIDDVRSTAEYRRTVAGNLVRRFWSDTGA